MINFQKIVIITQNLIDKLFELLNAYLIKNNINNYIC